VLERPFADDIRVCCITAQLRQRVGHCPKIIEKFRHKWGDNDNIVPLFCSKWDKKISIKSYATGPLVVSNVLYH
jgi:hypothetical protein